MQMLQLGQVAVSEADRINAFLLDATRREKALTEQRPCGDDPTKQCVFATLDLLVLLDRVPGYYLIYGHDSLQIYTSVGIRQLPEADRRNIDQQARKLVPNGEGVAVGIADPMFGGSLLLTARADSALGPGIARIVAGAPTTFIDLSPNTVARTMLVVLPFILIVSVGVSY